MHLRFIFYVLNKVSESVIFFLSFSVSDVTTRGQPRNMFKHVVIETDRSKAASIALVISAVSSVVNIIHIVNLISGI